MRQRILTVLQAELPEDPRLPPRRTMVDSEDNVLQLQTPPRLTAECEALGHVHWEELERLRARMCIYSRDGGAYLGYLALVTFQDCLHTPKWLTGLTPEIANDDATLIEVASGESSHLRDH